MLVKKPYIKPTCKVHELNATPKLLVGSDDYWGKAPAIPSPTDGERNLA